MASAPGPSKSAAERRKQVMLGELPANFLRLSATASAGAPAATAAGASGGGGGASEAPTTMDATTLKQIEADEMAARALASQLNGAPAAVPGGYYSSFLPPNTRGRLSITIVEAKLTKNYGLVRMDPYCRLRVGNTVFETPTNVSGAKNPKWNRTIHCYLPQGVETMYVEVFDERAFTTDERVAWSHLLIPPTVFNLETMDDWYPLSGPLGENKEGTINLVISFAPLDGQQQQAVVSPPVHTVVQGPVDRDAAVQQPAAGATTVDGAPTAVTAVPVATAAALYTDADVVELTEMFPNMEAEVVRSVLDEKRGNKDAAVNALLSMGTD